MRKKFKIYYPKDHEDPKKAGTQYKPSGKKMLCMNADGIFFLYSGDQYYSDIQKLSKVLPKYDVKWE